MPSTHTRITRLRPALALVLLAASGIMLPACRTTPGKAPTPKAPSLSPVSGEIAIETVARSLSALADEMPAQPVLAGELDLLIRDLRQAASAGPPSPILASKLGELLLLQPEVNMAALDEAERWFRASLTGATGSQDWVPGWIGMARVEVLRAAADGQASHLDSARASLANAGKAIDTIRGFAGAEGAIPTNRDAEGLTPSDAYSRLVAELAKNEALPTRFIAAGTAMRVAGASTQFNMVARLKARTALAEGEAQMVMLRMRATPTSADIVSAFQPALACDQNLIDVRVVLLEQLLASARTDARIDVDAAVQAHTQARMLLTLAGASGHPPDAGLLRALLRANNLIESSYLGRTLSPSEARDAALLAESSAQAIELSRRFHPTDSELLALASSHLAMAAVLTDDRERLTQATDALDRSRAAASTRSAAEPVTLADAEHLCRVASERLEVGP